MVTIQSLRPLGRAHEGTPVVGAAAILRAIQRYHIDRIT
jgi:hypothetical protein